MTSKGDNTSPAEPKSKQEPPPKGHDITFKTIKTPQFSYACLQLMSDSPPATSRQLDALTVRSYVGSALSQFLGLTGSAVSIDILKVEGRETWIRVPREDLSLVLAAIGGWTGGLEGHGKVGWTVKASGNWLGVLVAQGEAGQIWNQ
ncbi:hypothetical protein BKA65DRAFT_80697 [Rhexocercosporidium sp. MPI-PUGE-AT-0058]|nr:hypothetical protein BKA65DRAFT_80697 [Rhexocercosporidium sp. MPI-PUGE-AT-0058]